MKTKSSKSIIDLQNQDQRICNALETKYADMPKRLPERKHGLFLWDKNHCAYRKYTKNIVEYLWGVEMVRGNMKLLTQKVDRSIYMG